MEHHSTNQGVPVVKVDQTEIGLAFAEWERRRRADPESFPSRAESDAMTPEAYGEGCASYFIEILEEIL